MKTTHQLKLYLIALAVIVGACSSPNDEAETFVEDSEIFGLASLIQLEPRTTTVDLNDFFLDANVVDSVSCFECNSAEINFDSTNAQVLISVLNNKELPSIFTIAAWAKGVPYHIPVRKSNKQTIRFILKDEDKTYSKVSLIGGFNGWNQKANPMSFENKVWSTSVDLAAGQHQYKFLVDGVELLDPANPNQIPNGTGGMNSLQDLSDKSERPIIYVEGYRNNVITIQSNQKLTSVFALWNNHRLKNQLEEGKNNQYFVQLPIHASSLEESFVRVYAYNENGIANDVLIPLTNGKPVKEAHKLPRTQPQTQIIYNVFIDRFYNGNTQNDKPLNSPEVHPKADYFGGDLEGVIQKVNEKYFETIGVNTLWLSPIVRNPEGPYGQYPTPKTKFSGYHGYWPIRSTEIDYRLGNDSIFMALLNTAHTSNMNVLLDYVANHVHQEHPVYQEHPDWATDLYLPDGRQNTQLWDEERLTTWFDTFMPTLDFSKPEVVEAMTDSALYWFKNFPVDGFRHDATKHVPEAYWKTLTKKLKTEVLKPENRSIYQIGETYGNAELIGSYVNSGQLDAQFDFNLYDAAVQAFANPKVGFKTLVNTLNESMYYYGAHHVMGNITGNQDRARFISYADGSLRFDEDPKLAGWTRAIDNRDTTAFLKLSMLTAFSFFVPGVPVIYYGDEIGMPGGNDPDNRRMMQFDNHTKMQLYCMKNVSNMADVRKHSMALTYGDITATQYTDSTLLIRRVFMGDDAVLLINNSNSYVEFTVDSTISSNYKTLHTTMRLGEENKNEHDVRVMLPPFKFEILTNY